MALTRDDDGPNTTRDRETVIASRGETKTEKVQFVPAHMKSEDEIPVGTLQPVVDQYGATDFEAW